MDLAARNAALTFAALHGLDADCRCSVAILAIMGSEDLHRPPLPNSLGKTMLLRFASSPTQNRPKSESYTPNG